MNDKSPTVIFQSGSEEPPSPVETFRVLDWVDGGQYVSLPTEVDLDAELAGMGVSVPHEQPAADPPPETDVSRLRPVNDDYKLGPLLGKGGQGEVYSAHQVMLGRTVALKRAGASPSVQRDFFKEAFTSAQLDHPNIVPVYELGVYEHQGRMLPVLAMKRVEGSTWSSLLKMDREWRADGMEEYLSRHLPILIQVINAVAYAHSKNIIHRDLKPSQVMVGHYGEVFLLDWGLAVYLGSPSEPEIQPPADTRRLFTRESATCPAGTPAYMSPEQATSNASALGTHTDLYLVGAILYELLSGTPPHAERTVGAAVESARRNIYLPLSESTPVELRLLAERCMATDPTQRPASALEIKAALEQYLTGSGRKIDSRRLVSEVRAREPFAGYEDLSQAARMLSQASHLWPDNPDVPAEHQRLLSHFVAAAIGSGHFQLAYLQASRVADRTLGEQLRARVTDAQEAALRSMPRPPLLGPRRILILVLIYVVIISLVSGVLHYAHKTVMAEVGDKVRGIAHLAAREVQATDLDAVDRSSSTNTPEFQRTLSRLNSFRRANEDIRYIYTYRPIDQVSEKSWRVLVDADPLDIDANGNGVIDEDEAGNPPGSLYDEGVPAMRDAYTKRLPTSSVLIDQWGSFISGFAPVLHPETGEAVAIVGVDVPLDKVEQRLRMVNRAGLATGLLLALLLTGTMLAWFHSRNTLKLVKQLETELRRQSRELGEREIHLG